MQIFKDLVRYATLAPSSHNTQCWKFRTSEDSISVLPDFSRRCSVVDPDDHHLSPRIFNRSQCKNPEQGIDVKLRVEDAAKQANPSKDPLFDAIEVRQCNRGIYDGQSVSPEDLKKLKEAGNGDGVKLLLLTSENDKELIKEFVKQANSAQMTDRPFREELKSWVRFNDKEAKTTGDGLFGKCMGHPSAPRWFGNLIFDYGVGEKSENRKISDAIDSSAGVAVIVSEKDDPVHWVEAGRVYERFALTAASLGIHNAHLNQPVEVASVRPEFAKALNLPKDSRPDLVLRFGRGDPMPPSFRRPLEEVLQQT